MSTTYNIRANNVEFVLTELDDGRWSLAGPAGAMADELEWPSDDTIREQTGVRATWERWEEGDDLLEAIGYPARWPESE